MPETVSGRDIYRDVPLANVAIKAFYGATAFITPQLFPAVDVVKETGEYYIIDPNSWLLVPNTRRARKNSPRRFEWKVNSAKYVTDNHALAGELAKEDLANADAAIRLRENTTLAVTEGLLRAKEDRVALLVTSISNVGSGVALAGANKWGDYVGSNPITDVTTARAFIRQRTGLNANVGAADEDTIETLRTHPVLLDYYKYTSGGILSVEQIALAFRLEKIIVGTGIKNMAPEGATASLVNIWGNNFLLAHVEPAASLQTATFGLSFMWSPEGVPPAMQVERYDDPDPGKKLEIVQVGYYGTEVVVARDLSYLIGSTL